MHFYNNYVKIFTSTRQKKLKKILIKQKHVIQIMFHVNDETRPSPSFQELILLIYVKQTCSNSLFSSKELRDLHSLQYFSATLKLLIMCMKPDFLNILLKEPDGLSKYVKFLINYRGRKLENCYLNTEEKI